MKTPQEVRDEFIEELFKHAEIRSRAFENKIKKLLKSHEEKIVERIQKGIDKEIKPLKTSDPEIKQVRKFNQGLQKALEVIEKELLGKE